MSAGRWLGVVAAVLGHAASGAWGGVFLAWVARRVSPPAGRRAAAALWLHCILTCRCLLPRRFYTLPWGAAPAATHQHLLPSVHSSLVCCMHPAAGSTRCHGARTPPPSPPRQAAPASTSPTQAACSSLERSPPRSRTWRWVAAAGVVEGGGSGLSTYTQCFIESSNETLLVVVSGQLSAD